MKQEALARTGNIEAPSVRLHLTMWPWGAAIALALAMTVVFGWHFYVPTSSDQASLSHSSSSFYSNNSMPLQENGSANYTPQ
jgi:hypothetical protein